jgi:hypothetical protein
LQLEALEDRCVPSGLTAPALSSLPGAKASLYLDFTGLPTQTWGAYQNVTTPAFDLDGDPSSFSAQETAVITEVWQRVSEIYSPFDINVTTVAPADLSHARTQIVAIGGSYNDWYHQAAGGVSYVGSFANPNLPNVSHVFVDGTAGVAKYIAIAAAHESGHAFGLEHQSVLDANGNLVSEYNPGDAASAPIMGLPYNAARALWWIGPTDTGAIQNDEAVIAGAANSFGYRPDPYGQTLAAATPLTLLNGQAAVSGVIDTPASADWFTFTTSGGAASFTATTAAVGPTLHARLELWSAAGPIAVGDSATTLGASISTTLAAGRYYLVVRSHGGAGDVGQYGLFASAPSSGGSTGGAPGNGASPSLVFTVRPDGSLWAENLAAHVWTEISPAGTILATGASKTISGADAAFALASDHSLWEYTAAGWTILSPGGTINGLAAAPGGVVFALAGDGSLWRHNARGWAELSPAGTIMSVAGASDLFGGAEAFALASDHSLWQFDQNAWQMLSPAGTILSVGAAADSAVVIASDGSMWRHTESGWNLLSPPVQTASVTAGTDHAGNPAVFVLGADHSLWRYTVGQGWLLLSPAGTIQAITGGENGDVFVTAGDGNQWEYDGAAWSMVRF